MVNEDASGLSETLTTGLQTQSASAASQGPRWGGLCCQRNVNADDRYVRALQTSRSSDGGSPSMSNWVSKSAGGKKSKTTGKEELHANSWNRRWLVITAGKAGNAALAEWFKDKSDLEKGKPPKGYMVLDDGVVSTRVIRKYEGVAETVSEVKIASPVRTLQFHCPTPQSEKWVEFIEAHSAASAHEDHAVTIQANFRARSARKEFNAQKDAAIAISAARRGQLVRREAQMYSAPIELSEEELARMQTLFDEISDTKTSTGAKALSSAGLLTMSALLGEPHTEEEAADAIKHFHRKGKTARGPENKLDFEEFVQWWEWDHAAMDGKLSRRGRNYTARFKVNSRPIKNFELEKLSTVESGEAGLVSWRLHFMHESTRISPWHQIPLYADGVEGKHDNSALIHMVIEIPRATRSKFEIATVEPDNPIHQDVRNGTVREYKYQHMPHNYGAVPQTWEDPDAISRLTRLGGDNDPLDAIEIGSKTIACGEVCRVKVLGILAMIDDNETDWKLVVVREGDELFDTVSSCSELEKARPGLLAELKDWLRLYKTADGKPENEFAMKGKYQGPDTAHHVIRETHQHWSGLSRKSDD